VSFPILTPQLIDEDLKAIELSVAQSVDDILRSSCLLVVLERRKVLAHIGALSRQYSYFLLQLQIQLLQWHVPSPQLIDFVWESFLFEKGHLGENPIPNLL
jgi:hypothetical protein